MSLLPSVCRASSLFCWTYSQGCSGKTPGSKSNADGAKRWKGNAGLELHGTSLGFVSKVTWMKPKELPQHSHFVFSFRCKGKESLQPSASIPRPAPLGKEHPGMAYLLLRTISEARACSSVRHIALVFFQNNKVLLWKKESPDFPQISEA